MGQIRVRNLDDDVVAAWKERAKRHGHSLEAELRTLLIDEVQRPRRELVAVLKQGQAEMAAEGWPLTDSTASIRHERDRIG